MYLCIRLNRTSFCSDSSSSHVYPGFRKTAAISPAISSYRHVAAVDPDTAGVENHRNKPHHTLLGVSVTFTTWRIGFPFLRYLQRQPFPLWSLCKYSAVILAWKPPKCNHFDSGTSSFTQLLCPGIASTFQHKRENQWIFVPKQLKQTIGINWVDTASRPKFCRSEVRSWLNSVAIWLRYS